MTMANVIDISEYQDPAKFDYQAAKSNGIKAVIIRLSVGNRRDNHAAEHIANCKKYGLKWHGYHYWYNLSGEAAFAISDAQSLGLTSSQYFFLDMEDKTLSSDWSAQFESFRSAVGGKYKVGLYCSDSPYKSHFDNAKMVAEGVYRWIAAYSYEPANYDTWQMSGEGSGGFGSYTGDVDRDYDKTGNLFKEETQPITPSTTPLYRQIIGEAGYDTDSGIYGLGRSYDNGKTFHVMDTVYGRIYRQQDGDSIWPFLVNKVKAVLDWSNITNKPDLALKTDLTWSNVTGKPDVALKSDVAAVSAVASSANAKADSNAKLIADKASQADLNSVSATASSALDKATSNANALVNKVNKSDLTWTNIAKRPDVDSIASQASQAVVTANTAESQASAAGQAAAIASAQASAAKTTADTATATANAAKASASTASATAASAQQIANSASASASATAVALKSKADTATVNAQFTAVNSNVASAQATADSAVAGLAGKLDKTALTWGNVAGKPTNLATTESVAKAQSAADSAVSVANGAVTTANSAKSTATSAAGVANTANAMANSVLTKANSASTVASQANSTATQASQSASNAVSVANQAKSTADSASTAAANAQSSANSAQNTANTAIKASETLKDLGNYTATASGTTSNSTCSGLPRTSGVSMSRVYNNGYPTPYGNVLNVAGIGAGQLLLGWSGTSSANEHLYYRSHRDNGSGGWSTWDKIAYVSDLTWSNISGKPDVATKSDLTWANISGKPSIPSTFNGTISDTSTDFNNLVTEGHYDIQISPSYQGKNGPKDGNWGLLDVKVAGRMVVQTYYGDAGANVYVRNRRDGTTWTAWRQITFWS